MMLNSAKLGHVGLYKKNSIAAGALYTDFNTITKHLSYRKTLYMIISHQFTELIIKDMCFLLAPIGR